MTPEKQAYVAAKRRMLIEPSDLNIAMFLLAAYKLYKRVPASCIQVIQIATRDCLY